MVLKILGAAASTFFPAQYTVHIIITAITLAVLHAFSQGRKTSRERDLHARTFLITGGFTPLGLTLLQSLAQSGAHIIALTSHDAESPEVSVIISLLRSTTSNEQIYAETCDLTSPASIRSFCEKFLKGQDQRLDGIIFAHEYRHIGPLRWLRKSINSAEVDTKARESASLASFLIITLLLPALLVAPVERDIRIVSVVNPFYAAAAAGTTLVTPSPSIPPSLPQQSSIFLMEGARALRTIILTRHLQRILDALPVMQTPKADSSTNAVPVNSKAQKSNIVTVSVSPGISRSDTMACLLNADQTFTGHSTVGLILYILLQPFLRLLTKTPISAIQSILHVLFLPTPFKTHAAAATRDKPVTSQDEVLRPGSLYSECSIVPLVILPSKFTSPSAPISAEDGEKEEATSPRLHKVPVQLEDDRELGGELAGRIVWEAYEAALKIWEKSVSSS